MMCCSIALLLLTVGGFLTLWALPILYPFPDPKTTRGMDELQSIAQTTHPLIVALDRYKRDKGAYPKTLEALPPTYLLTAPDEQQNGLWDRWRYSNGEGHQISLVYVFANDTWMSYAHSVKGRGRWEYHREDGSATVLPFR